MNISSSLLFPKALQDPQFQKAALVTGGVILSLAVAGVAIKTFLGFIVKSCVRIEGAVKNLHEAFSVTEKLSVTYNTRTIVDLVSVSLTSHPMLEYVKLALISLGRAIYHVLHAIFSLVTREDSFSHFKRVEIDLAGTMICLTGIFSHTYARKWANQYLVHLGKNFVESYFPTHQ